MHTRIYLHELSQVGSQDRVSEVANMQGPIGVGGRVLDDELLAGHHLGGTERLAHLQRKLGSVAAQQPANHQSMVNINHGPHKCISQIRGMIKYLDSCARYDATVQKDVDIGASSLSRADEPLRRLDLVIRTVCNRVSDPARHKRERERERERERRCSVACVRTR